MEKILKTLILIVLFIGLIAGAGLLYTTLEGAVDTNMLVTAPTETHNTTPTASTAAPSKAAPDFTVVDREGNRYQLSDFRGKPVVLNFWASWCGPCKSEMPDFQAAYEQYGDDIHFLMVNLTDGAQESVDSAWSFIDSQGYTFPVYYDTSISAAMAYGVSSIPVTYFIDANGDLVAYGSGALNAATLQKGIDMIYK